MVLCFLLSGQISMQSPQLLQWRLSPYSIGFMITGHTFTHDRHIEQSLRTFPTVIPRLKRNSDKKVPVGQNSLHQYL